MVTHSSLLDTDDIRNVIDELWVYLLPSDGRQMLQEGAHLGYVLDLCLPDRDADRLAPLLWENLAAGIPRTPVQVIRFFNFFKEDDEADQESGKPGGTSLFDRAFGLSKNIDLPKLQRMNRIIMGQAVTPDLPIEDSLRVMRYLIETSYLVMWVLTDSNEIGTISPLDQMRLRHDVRMWHHILNLVDQGRL